MTVFVIAVPVLGLDVTVPQRPGAEEREPLELTAVIPAALIASFAGWTSLAFLERASKRPLLVWTSVAMIVYLATLPYLPGFELSERLMLTVMHSALAAVLIAGCARPRRPQPLNELTPDSVPAGCCGRGGTGCPGRRPT